MYLTGWIGIFL